MIICEKCHRKYLSLKDEGAPYADCPCGGQLSVATAHPIRGQAVEIDQNSEAEAGARQCGADAGTEAVNHPAHYNKGKFEVIEVIEDWRLNFQLGNAIKYIARHNHKANALEDLKKAAWYLNDEIKRLEAGRK